MTSAKLFLLFSLFFLGGIAYIAVTHDLSPATLATVGCLGLASLLLGVLIGRENPTALVHLLLVVCATVTLFAATVWWHSRIPAAGVVAAATAPLTLIFAGLTLRWRSSHRDARPPQ